MLSAIDTVHEKPTETPVSQELSVTAETVSTFSHDCSIQTPDGLESILFSIVIPVAATASQSRRIRPPEELRLLSVTYDTLPLSEIVSVPSHSIIGRFVSSQVPYEP